MIWITRDRLPDGELIPGVHVWDIRPTRYTDLQSVGGVWLDAKGQPSHVDCMNLIECHERYGVIPDDDTQLIKVGRK